MARGGFGLLLYPGAGPRMTNVLTSWKEIGQYLGKGVRTVQRWERESALPVRRPTSASRRAVLAFPEELDRWTRTRMKGPGASLVETLSRDLAALREETAELRYRVEYLEIRSSGDGQPTGSRIRLQSSAKG